MPRVGRVRSSSGDGDEPPGRPAVFSHKAVADEGVWTLAEDDGRSGAQTPDQSLGFSVGDSTDHELGGDGRDAGSRRLLER
jgi:hypothetical protein